MNTPFRLDNHPRRSQPPLASPPDRYFEQLPTRVMERVTSEVNSPVRWLGLLPAPLRTALASVVLLGGFATTYVLIQHPPTPPADSLASVPQQELVDYLLASDQRVTLTDLAELPATAQPLPETYLQASPSEVQDVLDAQPLEDTYL
ncbi:hypothetical protein [Hymenobacter sp. AT01-02]|uniref:hypothetical protein n=1 Tax=Hymenobacter sp. AT01-02 TaxID=1571877 RepID=UPI0005F1E61D|nr:hypothetical protein [Hymenobacter sp. AT01-02]